MQERSLEWYQRLISQILREDMSVYQNQKDVWQLLLGLRQDIGFNDKDTLDFAMKASRFTHKWAEYMAGTTGSADFDEMYWNLLLLEAPNLLDSFALYIEKNRKPEDRFYQPRRKTLKQAVEKLQDLEDDKLDELFMHFPPRVGKSQIITIGTAWHCAKNAENSNLYVTYKEGLGGAFIDGCMEIWTDPTYCTADVFQTKIARTDAKNHKVDLGRKKKYATLSGKGLESGLNGEYDVYGWLILDDILEGIQDVLNPDILHRKQIVFDNNVMSRRKEKCKTIFNGTIWSLHDLYMDRLAFLQNNPEAANIRYSVLKIPALDPETDESNFDYEYGVGFSTSYYKATRAKFEENDDIAGWLAQYQQEPIERDGALFNPQHMNFYNGVLPAEEPLKVISACDVALGGVDYLAMPVAYCYEDGSVYIHDVVFDNSEKKYTLPKVVTAIIDNKVTSAFFEANAGGEGYKDEVSMRLKENGYETNLTSKFAQQMILRNGSSAPKSAARKEQRIWDNAETIRKFYFRDAGYQSAEYRKFMNNVYAFSMTGKNKHDDAPDALASLAVFLNNGSGAATVKATFNPFWGRR